MRTKGLRQADVWLTKVPSVSGELDLSANWGRGRGSDQPGHSRCIAEGLFGVAVRPVLSETFPAASVPPHPNGERWERQGNMRRSLGMRECEGVDWGGDRQSATVGASLSSSLLDDYLGEQLKK